MDQEEEDYFSPIRKDKDDSIRLNSSSPELVLRIDKLENAMQQIISLLTEKNQKVTRQQSPTVDETLVRTTLNTKELLNLGGHHDDESSESSTNIPDKEVKLKFKDNNEILRKVSDELKIQEQDKILEANRKERRKSLGSRMIDAAINAQEVTAAKSKSVRTRVFIGFGNSNRLEEELHDPKDVGQWLELEEKIRLYIINEEDTNILVHHFVKKKKVKEVLCAMFNSKVEEVKFRKLNLTPMKLDMISYEEFRIWIQSAHRPETPKMFCSTLLKLTNALVTKESERKMFVSLYNILYVHPTLMNMCRNSIMFFDHLALNNVKGLPFITKGEDSIKVQVIQKLEPKVFGHLYSTIETELRNDSSKTYDLKTITFQQLMGAYMVKFDEMYEQANNNVLLNAPFSQNRDTETSYLMKTLTSYNENRSKHSQKIKNLNNINEVNEEGFNEEDLEYLIDEYMAIKSEKEYEDELDYLDEERYGRDVNSFGSVNNQSGSNNINSKSLANTNLTTYKSGQSPVCMRDVYNGVGTCNGKCGAISHSVNDVIQKGYEQIEKLMKANKLDKSKILLSNDNDKFVPKNNSSNGYNAVESFKNHKPNTIHNTVDEILDNINKIHHIQRTYKLDDDSMAELYKKVYSPTDKKISDEIKEISLQVSNLKESVPGLKDFVSRVKVSGILVLNDKQINVKAILDCGAFTKDSLINTDLYEANKSNLKTSEIKNTKIQLNGFNGKSEGILETKTILGSFGFEYKSEGLINTSKEVTMPFMVADLGKDTDMIISLVHLAKYFSGDMIKIFVELGKLGEQLLREEENSIINGISSDDFNIVSLDLTRLMQINMITVDVRVDDFEEESNLLNQDLYNN